MIYDINIIMYLFIDWERNTNKIEIKYKSSNIPWQVLT